MKLLVFGKTGQVARELQIRCPAGWSLIALDRNDADLGNPLSCAAKIEATNADVIINAAAYTAVDNAETDESQAQVVNADAPAAMALAAKKCSLPFVHISTDYVFDGSGHSPRTTFDKPAPINAYGRTKLAGECAIEKVGGRHVILRTSWVFSSHGQNFVKTMMNLGKSNPTLRIISDQVGGPTSAASIADAVFAICRRMETTDGPSGVYHFAGSPETSWADFAREIFALSGTDTSVANINSNEYLTAAARPLNTRLDCSSVQDDFGIQRPDWRIGLKSVLEELSKK